MNVLKWRTIITPRQLNQPINTTSKLMFAGSCFSENLGGFLQSHQLDTVVNPTGILFNPISLASCIQDIHHAHIPAEDEFFFHADLWRHFNIHSQLAHPEKEIALQAASDAILNAHQHLTTCSNIAITLGTARVYRHKQSGNIVANNHKLPADHFDKELLSSQEIVDAWIPVIELFPDKQWIFTVSPVRHTRDGIVENMRSKAILLEAIHRICEAYNNVYYFPAFEIMMDDLRDYRFYEADLIHPNEQALMYIRQLFIDACIHPHAAKWIDLYGEVLSAKNHKPFFPESEGHKKFMQQTAEKIATLQNQFPEMDLSADMQWASGS